MLVASSTAGLWAQSPSEQPLPEQLLPGLPSILTTSLQQSPRIVQRNLDLVIADANEQMARSKMLPNVSFSTSINRQWEKRDDNNSATREKFELTKKLYYNFAISQPIYHWGALKNGVEIARINERISERNYQEAYRLLALEVRSAYLQLILAKMAVRNNTFAEKRAQDRLTREEGRAKANQITVGELMNYQLASDDVGAVARRSESDLEFGLRNFRRLTGLSDFTVADIPDVVPALDANPKGDVPALDAAYLDSNALQLNAFEIEKAKLEEKILSKNHYPKLGVSIGTNQDEQRYTKTDAPYKVEAIYAGLNLNWNIFDGFQTRAQRLQNATRLKQLEIARKDLIEIAKQDAELSARSVALAWNTYRVQSQRFRFAREGLSFQQQQLQRGESSRDNVEAAQGSSYGAEYTAQSALIGYLNAVASFRSTIHTDPAVMGVATR